MVTRGTSSATPISSLKCTWTRLSARKLQLGLGCSSSRRARRLPRNLVMEQGGVGGLSLSVQGQRRHVEGGPSGLPSSPCVGGSFSGTGSVPSLRGRRKNHGAVAGAPLSVPGLARHSAGTASVPALAGELPVALCSEEL